jgi:tricarballylate dehydrogenase
LADLSRLYDVLVIGGGNAGICAAIAAREAGASVLLVEHAPKHFRGGNSRHTRNLRAMHEAPTATLTESYPEEEYFEDLLRVTGDTDEKLARLTIRESATLPDWMGKRGVRFQPSLTGTLSLSRTNAFFLGGGKALLNGLYNHAAAIGVETEYDTEIIAINLDDGFVRDISAISRGFPVTLRAKCIVTSSGGFQGNLEWLKEIWGEAADNFLIRGTPYAKGKVLRNLLANGVQEIGDPSQFHCVGIDARAPKFDGGIVTRIDCIPYSIVINTNGVRFYDEGEDLWPKRYAVWGRLIAQQPGQIAWSIFDAKVEPLFMPSVYAPYKADTLAGLAAQIGADPAQLEKTVADYNAAVQDGNFRPQILDGCRTQGLTPDKTNWARPIDTPPYFSYPHRPGITFTYLGVKVDENARVHMSDGKPSANLFASGEIMAGSILSKGYLAGFGMTIGAVFGRIAGREAARHARN